MQIIKNHINVITIKMVTAKLRKNKIKYLWHFWMNKCLTNPLAYLIPGSTIAICMIKVSFRCVHIYRMIVFMIFNEY